MRGFSPSPSALRSCEPVAMDVIDTVSREKLSRYFAITGQALKKVKIAAPKKTPLHAAAADFHDMASRYYQDANYFFSKGNYVLSFAAINYAHGWLDAGARLGLFDVKYDSKLFTVDDEPARKRKPQRK